MPWSQISTVPAPYSPSGISPSNVAYSSGWSSTWTARCCCPGSSGTPFGTAQLSERAVALEPEVVVEPPGVVALDDEDRLLAALALAERLGRLAARSRLRS